MQVAPSTSQISESASEEYESRATEFREAFERLRTEMGKILVGQDDVIRSVLTAFFAEGHALLEGAPGLGKTAIVRTLAAAAGLRFSRIQFTPDLMPSDIIGTNLIIEDQHGTKRFQFEPGPIFANIILADEVNRPLRKPRAPCSKRCRNDTSRLQDNNTSCRGRFSCSRLKIPSRWRALIRSPKLNSTDFC